MRRILWVIIVASAAWACGGPTATAPGDWVVDHVESDGVLLSVWGSSSRDVWAAGGQVGRGLILHSTGGAWDRVEAPAPSLVWWVYGFTADDVYAVGEHGLILHFDGSSWQRIESGTDRTLYGLWGASGRDVWIVGGEPGGAPGSGVILRGNANGFSSVEGVPSDFVPDAFFKVYGITNDVIVVGRAGTVLRYDGQAWRRDAVPTDRAIVSLWARGPDDVFAVGGQEVGEILHFDGTRWSPLGALSGVAGLNGVFTGPARPVVAVGAGAAILEWSTTGTLVRRKAVGLDPRHVLHSVWGDEQGTVYAVGGSLLEYPAPMEGVIVRSR